MSKPQKHTILIACAVLALALMALAIDSVFFGAEKETTDHEVSSLDEPLDSILREAPDRHERLVPHKALYKVELSSKAQFSQIQDITGEMLYELRRGCDAWTTKHKFILNYSYAEGPPLRITSDYSTYESFDGLSFNFSSTRKRNQDVFEEFRGVVTIDTDTGAASVTYSEPEERTEDLPAGIKFPMGHTLAVLNKIEAGETFYTVPIFDGSDSEGAVSVNAFIGREVKIDLSQYEVQEDVDTDLIDNQATSLRLAFFPLSAEDSSVADYEMDIVFHENGVISDMGVDYEEFSVKQELSALEVLSAETCE